MGPGDFAGYTPPADRPTEPASRTRRTRTSTGSTRRRRSPSRRATASRSRARPGAARQPDHDVDVDLDRDSVTIDLRASGPGRARIFLWSGEKGYIPVWVTSCSPAADPPPDYGMTPCAATDGTTPPWSPDMSGRVVRDVTLDVTRSRHRVTIPLDAAAYERLAAAARR